MCGICGFAFLSGQVDKELLARMRDRLAHRGPDAAALWADARPGGATAGLAIRRLAIIDPETGHQPVFNETETVAVVFNGEIYNHVELRAELEARGHRFRSHHSDTEVIVHLYEEYGEEFAHRLNGMFAIALWDLERRQLVLVRDRVGIKPLYYASLPAGIVFGSEPKSILAHPAVAAAPDLVAIHHYLSFKNIPAPHSGFAAIRQLRAGEMLRWSERGLAVTRWWRLRPAEDARIGEHEAAGELRRLLEDSVRLQMRSDVPVGAYLSGGVDSSSVVSIIRRLGAPKLKTFTLIYEDGSRGKDTDRQFAQQLARELGTEHHEQLVRFADVEATIEAVIGSFDEPFSGVISTYYLTELISRHVKVALSGDGADELFASYLPHRLAQPLALVTAGGDEVAAHDLSASDRARLPDMLKRGDEAARRMGCYIADDAAKTSLYAPRMREAVADAATERLIRALYEQSGTRDPLNRALFVDFETMLPDQVLAFVDRLSMAHSVEVRPPFLDHRIVELAARLPGAMKIKAGRAKHILKQAVSGLLPDAVIDRAKEGFIMPVEQWLIERHRPYVESVLSPARLAVHGLFDPGAIGALIEACYRGAPGTASRIWNLVVLQLWWERYVKA